MEARGGMNRRWRAGLALVLAAAAAGTLAQAPAGEREALPVRELAPGVFVHAGVQEETAPGNQGAIANIGFIVGSKCVAVVDTGGTLAAGQRLRRAVARATEKPVCYVINTHVHPDHIFGNAAFAADRPVYVGHARLPAAMAARGRNYRQALARDLGQAAAGSELIAPGRTVEERLELDLGERVLELRAWPVAHTDNDLTVFDRQSGVLWLSDLLFVERTPVVDGSLRGWLDVMAELRRQSPRAVVAGHGDAGADWRAALGRQEAYLHTLLDETRAAIKAGRTLPQAVAQVGAGQQGAWLLFEQYHRRNVTAAYAELEWED